MNILEINLFLILIYAFLFLLVIRTGFSKKLFISVVTIQMIIINGLRHVTVGNDTLRYEQRFLNILETNSFSEVFKIDREFGYNFTQKLFSLFSDNFNAWLFMVSLFLFITLGYIIYKYSKSVFISYLLFIMLGFYGFSFTGIRQSIAIIIVLISYKYILNKKFIKFLLVMFFATIFHNSAIVFLPMYFLAQVKWKRYHIFVFLFFYFLFFIFRMPIGEMLSILYRDEMILDRYTSTGSIGGLAIMILLIVLFGTFVFNPIKYKERENIILSNIMVISFFVQSLSSFSYLFTRLNMYFLIFIILYIPYLINHIDKLPIRLTARELFAVKFAIKSFIMVSFIWYYLANLENDGSGIFPYYFFWE